MEQPRDLALELVIGLRDDFAELRSEVAELRASVTHLTGDMGEVRADVRRLDNRFFQVMLVQLATLGTAFASLVAAIA